MTPAASAGSPVPDFRSLDFDRLWAGRDRVTQVERLVVRDALSVANPARVLEIGAGVGRLSPTVQEGVREYAALDVTPEFLVRVPLRRDLTSLRVAANVFHLPFADGSFPAVVMVRVFGFLPDPRAALEEIRRVLSTKGVLLLSYNPRPSMATFVDDLKVALSRRSGETATSMTFSRRPVVPVRPSSFPAWSLTRAEFRRTVGSAGLVWGRERPTGWEEYPGLRRLPAELFLSISRAMSNAGGFPTRFALLERPDRARGPLPPWDTILACPCCRTPFESRGRVGGPPLPCRHCGRSWPWSNGILDLRWQGAGPPAIALATGP